MWGSSFFIFPAAPIWGAAEDYEEIAKDGLMSVLERCFQ
jgi:hypothetical protein